MASSGGKSDVEILTDKVDELYQYRDHYFENNGIEKAVQKNDDVVKKMEWTFDFANNMKDKIENKAIYFMMLGKILNVKPDYDRKAEEFLSKSVKLDPKLVEGWNHLGELYWKRGDVNNAKNCFTGALTHSVKLDPQLVEGWNHLGELYWKRGDVINAKNCFTGALTHSKNKISLRNLSMVLRQLNDSAEQKSKNVEDSVEKAKEAVQLDLQDGQSWLILGNAYLSLFFTSGQNPKVLSQAMSAYKQAEKDPVAKNNADLHYNRASVFRFEEDFQAALEGYSTATMLDPGWKDPEGQEKTLLNYLASVTEMIEAKGKVKGKRLQTLSQSPRESALGPYAGGSYTSSSGKSVKLMRCSFKDLEPGTNGERVVLGKVACTVPNESVVPFTFCMLDEDETCLPVNVYNIAQGTGVKIGDSVAIPEPFIQHVNVSHKGKVFNFNSIRVNTPVILVVNGRKLGIDKQAGTILVVNAMSE